MRSVFGKTLNIAVIIYISEQSSFLAVLLERIDVLRWYENRLAIGDIIK